MSDLPTNDSSHENSKLFLTVGIGASAGGITALKDFFTAMPPDSGMAFVVILHLSPEHESQLDTILQSVTKMPVIQVQKTLQVEPNHVYVIPPTKFLVMMDGEIHLTEPEKTRGKRVPIDLLFRTMADAHHRNCVAIVLSGTGSDGTLGLKRVKEAGGICLVQDPEEAEYSDMPSNAMSTGLVDLALPVSEMPKKLLDIKRGIDRFNVTPEEGKTEATGLNTDALHDILAFLKTQTGHDFANYKHPTLLRRLTRRLQVHGFDDIPPYFDFLQGHPEEAQALLRDLLISVTNFFRDKEAFVALEETVIPQLFKNKGAEDQVRVWSVACATGEEAYSLAILLSEYAANLSNPPKIQIFASDIDESALAVARSGRYDDSIELDVSPPRLHRFFTKVDHAYIVKEELRELVLFAPHNILRDPPFSRQDLVICRNLLIYLNHATQEKVFEIFHFSLRTNGMMFLGASESAESMSSLFSLLNKKHRIYQSRPSMVKRGVPTIPFIQHQAPKTLSQNTPKYDTSFSFAEVHGKLVERFAAPSVLVDENYDILHTSGNAAPFLQFASGEPTRNLLKSVLAPLKQDLLATLYTARYGQRLTQARNIPVDEDDVKRFINITVQPVDSPAAAKGFFLVMFHEIREEDIPSDILKTVLESKNGDAAEIVINRLEEELQQRKDRLRLTIEAQETTVEELKASNEELQTMNEELRSTTEELETGREELQSVNEEMTTVNHELKEKVDEVSRGAADLRNLMASTDIGTLFLDCDLNIKLYTPTALQIFNIIASDLGRPLEHITHKLDYENLIDDANEVLRSLQSIQREVHSFENRWYLARLKPYRTMDDHIDGVIITFIDFTERKESEIELERITHASEEQYPFFAAALSNINDFISVLDRKGRFCYSNKAHCDLVNMTLEEIVGKTYLELNFPKELAARMHLQVQQVFETNSSISDEAALTDSNGIQSDYEYRFSPVIKGKDEVEFVVGSVWDITRRKRDEKALQAADLRKDVFLATLAHELRNPLAPIRTGLELIRRSKGDTEITQRTLNIIERQTSHIVHLVDDLLEIARISQGKVKLRPERFDIKTVIDTTVESCEEDVKINKHQITVSLPEEPIFIKADSLRVEQILLNLLTNAIKYTPPSGQIWLNARKTDSEAIVSVRDNGLGIRPDRIVSIFEMFNQVESTPQNANSGLGIGLGVVKQLVEMHGGSVSAASEGEGKGSEFTVHLPLASPLETINPTSEKETNMTEEIEPAKRKILIVDDNADVAEMVKALLSLEGHDIRVAGSGEEGIEVAKEFQPDVCLCDIGLPKMDGYELGRQLRVLLPDAKLIAFSGYGQDSDRQRSKDAGFDEHLVKASNIDQLIQMIA